MRSATLALMLGLLLTTAVLLRSSDGPALEQSASSSSAVAALRPRIVADPIPFPAKRKREMDRYVKRHYGRGNHVLRRPRVIVEHFTAGSTYQSAFNTFAVDAPDSELHELPGTCSHFIIDKDGTIYQLVPLAVMCRHTVGLNDVSWGIEHVGTSDAQILGNRAQMRSSLRLTRWLRCRAEIGIGNVIGHAESLSSPYHHENVARLKTQTHGDMGHAAMQQYRRRLRLQGRCP